MPHKKEAKRMQYLFETSAAVLANFELDTWLLARERLFLFMQKESCHVNVIIGNVLA
jgi:hypothetical protein